MLIKMDVTYLYVTLFIFLYVFFACIFKSYKLKLILKFCDVFLHMNFILNI